MRSVEEKCGGEVWRRSAERGTLLPPPHPVSWQLGDHVRQVSVTAAEQRLREVVGAGEVRGVERGEVAHVDLHVRVCVCV